MIILPQNDVLGNVPISWYTLPMRQTIQFHIYQDEQGYSARCLDMPVITQAKSLDELKRNMEEALELHLEGEKLSTLGVESHPAVFANIELSPLSFAHAL